MKRLSDLLDGYRGRVTSFERPKRWPSDPLFDHLVLAPERVLVVAGPPGVGKTALVWQWVVDALLKNEDLVAYAVNVQMTALQTLHRVVSRLASVDLAMLLDNAVLPRYTDRLDDALARLGPATERLWFGEP